MTRAPSVPLVTLVKSNAFGYGFVAPSISVLASDTSNAVAIRSATDADWPSISLLDAASFGRFGHPESLTAWRSLMPTDSTVLACDGDDVVGMAHYLDLRLTVPGGAVLPMAGVTIVGVAPTHRRRGILRAMYTERHNRITDARYPIAGLTASEGGIYGRFGYGPATIEQEFTVDRRFARFREDAPDPGGVRMVKPADHRDDLEAIYERWRRRTPGGLVRPESVWDEMLMDRKWVRRGGTEYFAFLHPDGYVLYRVFGDGRARCTPTDAEADINMDLDVLGSLYLGAHKASSFASANRLRTKDSGLLARLDAAFLSDVPAVLGFGF